MLEFGETCNKQLGGGDPVLSVETCRLLGSSNSTPPNRPSPHSVSRENQKFFIYSTDTIRRTQTIFIFSAEPAPRDDHSPDLSFGIGFATAQGKGAMVAKAIRAGGAWRRRGVSCEWHAEGSEYVVCTVSAYCTKA